jgi:sialidase-1
VKRVAGRLDGAAVFDGTSGYVEGKDAPELRLKADMTVALWVKKDAEPPDWVRLVGKGSVAKRNFGVWEEPGDGRRILWQIYAEEGGEVVSFYSKGTVEVGRWHHVACVRRGKTAAIYLDGRKDSQADCAEGTPSITDAPVIAGLAPGTGHTYLNGALDDVRVYRRALSEEEIAELFQAGQ